MTDVEARGAPPLEILLGGEIDLANAAALGDDLCDAIDRAAGNPIVIDLGEVTFIDSTAITMMIRVHTYAKTSRQSVTWRDLQRAPRRTLEIAGVDRALHLE
jgi:anti-anti-sigma factor